MVKRKDIYALVNRFSSEKTEIDDVLGLNVIPSGKALPLKERRVVARSHKTRGADYFFTLLQRSDTVGEILQEMQSAPEDGDILYAVNLFFDSLLEHHQLHEITRGLLSKLEGPITKLALLDTQFFSDANMPGRRFIKLVVDCDVFLSEADTMPIAKAFESGLRKIVQSLESEFESDQRLFLKAYYDLRHLRGH